MNAFARCIILALLALVMPPAASSAAVEPADRPIGEIRVEGLVHVAEQLVLNQVRSAVGEPYDPRTVEQDIVRLTHLGRFDTVRAAVEPREDGSVTLTFIVDEQAALVEVGVVGNRALTDEHLLEQVMLSAGDPAEPFLIEQGQRRLVEAYQDRGYFVAEVSVDQELLDRENILVYRVREGPRVRIRQLIFQGNHAYRDRQLRAEIASRTYIPVFRSGQLSREQLELDAAAVRQFYQERGYLDAQVGRRIELTPDQQQAVVTFLIDEGQRYTVDEVRIEGAELFGPDQIHRFMPLQSGDIFTMDGLDASRQMVRDMYGRLGYLEADIEVQRLFHEDEPRVDLLVRVNEGVASNVGQLSIRGNEQTKDRVVLREIRGMEPGRPFDRTGVDETERRLRESPMFSQATVTVLGEPEDPARDVIVEVEEQDTGSINLGVGVSSDLGLMGAIDLIQRNFDIADPPDSFQEFITGQAFRGAGQYFQLSLQPGTEASRYAINFREPALFESRYFLDTNAFYFSRQRRDYDERRVGGGFGLGRHFGDIYSASIDIRAQEVAIRNISDRAPTDVFDVRGHSALTGLGVTLERDMLDSRSFPTEGSHAEVTLERVGALGGDYDFTKLDATYRHFWTVREDFFERRSVLSTRVQMGHNFERGEAPIFERFYAGGHRTLRGFEFRGIGPRGVRADTGEPTDRSIGGDWKLLTSFEYQFPLFGMPEPGQHVGMVSGAVFSDMGTVRETPGFTPWRASVGGGLRIRVPFMGGAPFAIDAAYPVRREPGDQRQIISFDLALPLP